MFTSPGSAVISLPRMRCRETPRIVSDSVPSVHESQKISLVGGRDTDFEVVPKQEPCGQLDYTRRGRWPARGFEIVLKQTSERRLQAYVNPRAIEDGGKSKHCNHKKLDVNHTTFLKRHERVIIKSL